MGSLKAAVLLVSLAAFSLANSRAISTATFIWQVCVAAATHSAARLPITRVILYENGVGYFEHSGHVRGSQVVNVDFTTGSLGAEDRFRRYATGCEDAWRFNWSGLRENENELRASCARPLKSPTQAKCRREWATQDFEPRASD